MNRQRKSLSQILHAGDRDSLSRAWGETQPAADFAPLPAGEYVTHIASGELFNSPEKNTPGYKLCFQVIEGSHQNRWVWHDIWLTQASLPMAKRDLLKLGVTSLDQLETPLPMGIRCAVRIVLRRGDDGVEHNRVQKFTVVGFDPPEADPFAPVTSPSSDSPLNAAGGAQCQ
jgi:hypothetical protein